MLTQVVATNDQGSVLVMPLEDISGGITIQNIDGLGPVKATIVTSSFAAADGVQYLSARREPRNLVFTLGLEPDPSLEAVRDVRNRLYAYFMSKMNVALQFADDTGLVVNINGMIETCEPAIFSQEPAIDVSITCFKPEFIDPAAVVLNENTVDATTDLSIDYEGTVETGLLFQLLPNRDIDAFTIYSNLPSGLTRRLDFEHQLHDGDTLTINTRPGEKEVTLMRSSVPSSLLYGMSPQSSWIDFQPGTNTFRVQAAGDPVPYTLTYYNRYGGL